MDTFTLPCIKCGKSLQPVFEDNTNNQPSGGTSFRSYGQYGSTAFDPMDQSYLEINLCDSCLNEVGKLGSVLLCKGSTEIGKWLKETKRHIGDE